MFGQKLADSDYLSPYQRSRFLILSNIFENECIAFEIAQFLGVEYDFESVNSIIEHASCCCMSADDLTYVSVSPSGVVQILNLQTAQFTHHFETNVTF